MWSVSELKQAQGTINWWGSWTIVTKRHCLLIHRFFRVKLIVGLPRNLTSSRMISSLRSMLKNVDIRDKCHKSGFETPLMGGIGERGRRSERKRERGGKSREGEGVSDEKGVRTRGNGGRNYRKNSISPPPSPVSSHFLSLSPLPRNPVPRFQQLILPYASYNIKSCNTTCDITSYLSHSMVAIQLGDDLHDGGAHNGGLANLNLEKLWRDNFWMKRV